MEVEVVLLRGEYLLEVLLLGGLALGGQAVDALLELLDAAQQRRALSGRVLECALLRAVRLAQTRELRVEARALLLRPSRNTQQAE